MTAIVTIGIDLAKNVFAVHGVDATGKPALVRITVPRAKLLELIASLPSCLIGMEACSRHPNGAGVAGAFGWVHDHDLHACAEGGCRRHGQPAGCVGV